MANNLLLSEVDIIQIIFIIQILGIVLGMFVGLLRRLFWYE